MKKAISKMSAIDRSRCPIEVFFFLMIAISLFLPIFDKCRAEPIRRGGGQAAVWRESRRLPARGNLLESRFSVKGGIAPKT
jgi:hypothetical protein